MEIKTVLGLTIPQIRWMKMYLDERLIEIPELDDFKLELRDDLK